MDPSGSFEDLADQWVIVSGERILAHDKDLVKILRKADEMDDEDISVRKVLTGQACFY